MKLTCEYCGKSYSFDYLQKHLRKEHGKSLTEMVRMVGKQVEAKRARQVNSPSEVEQTALPTPEGYPNPEWYEKLTAYYPEPHARGWRGLSLQEFWDMWGR